MTSLYDVLEIKPNASEQEIRKAYYNLSKKYHPDKNKESNSCQKFQEINSAYQILMDEKTRRKYLQLDEEEKNKFQKILEKLFTDKLKLNELNGFGISFSRKDWDYLDNNFTNILSNIN